MRSPVIAKFITYEAVKANSLESFVGDSTRIPSTKELHCLYKRDLPLGFRTKYGISSETSAVIHISTVEYENVIGPVSQFNENAVVVEVFGLQHAILKKALLEPLFNTSVSIQLHLKSLERGA